MKIKRGQCQWKPLKLDENLISKGAIEGLVGVEELTDYSIIKGSFKKKIKDNADSVLKSSEKLRKKKSSANDINKPKKAKKKKVNKKVSEQKPPVLKKIQRSYSSKTADFDKSKVKKADISLWKDLFVPQPVLEALSSLGYSAPTPIQTLALPSAIRDRLDIIGAAETGSGKTLAFGIPVINSILRDTNENAEISSEFESCHMDAIDEDKNNDSDVESGVELENSDLENIEDVEMEESGEEIHNADTDELDQPEELSDDDNDDGSGNIGCVKVIDDIEIPWDTTELNQDKSFSSVKALILTPTRELAIQVKNHLLNVTVNTDIKLSVVVGGMSTEKQRRILRKNPDIVVATPGRLWELIQEGNPHACSIKNIQSLVIDEADRMVEKGHFAELTNILNYINSAVDKRRQTFVFSATLTLTHDAPKRYKLKKKKKVKLTAEQKLQSIMDLIGMKKNPKIIDITKKLGTVDSLTEARINCAIDEKDYYVYYFLKQFPGRTLIFANSVDCIRRLTSLLTVLKCSPLPLHASMHQKQRLKNLERFTSDKNGLLLATDVAARGLDIPEIEHVIHYQVPRTSETYVHRSGRTARAYKEGLSVMLIEPQEINNYRRMCRTLNRDNDLVLFPVDPELLPNIKERVSLAREIDKTEHHNRKVSSKNNWIQRTAEQMDLEISDDELYDIGNQEEQAKSRRKLTFLRKQMDSLLKKSLIPGEYLGKYPTKSGKLVSLTENSQEKAITTMKSEIISTRELLKQRNNPKTKSKLKQRRKKKK